MKAARGVSAKHDERVRMERTQNNFIHINGIESGNINIEIFDMNGKRILNRNQNSEKLDPINLNSFSKGVYMVKVSTELRKATKKILINFIYYKYSKKEK